MTRDEQIAQLKPGMDVSAIGFVPGQAKFLRHVAGQVELLVRALNHTVSTEWVDEDALLFLSPPPPKAAPGHCSKAESESEAGYRQMLEEAHDQRDRAIANLRHATRMRAQAEADLTTLRAQHEAAGMAAFANACELMNARDEARQALSRDALAAKLTNAVMEDVYREVHRGRTGVYSDVRDVLLDALCGEPETKGAQE